MSFFSSLQNVWDQASQVAAQLSLDNLQQQFGVEEATAKANRQHLDLSYLTPRVIGECPRAPFYPPFPPPHP
jgi:hypothetical protein